MNSPQHRPNEDDDIDPAEIEAAADETPADGRAPELDPRTENLTAWEEAPTSTGTAAPRVVPEDETSTGQ